MKWIKMKLMIDRIMTRQQIHWRNRTIAKYRPIMELTFRHEIIHAMMSMMMMTLIIPKNDGPWHVSLHSPNRPRESLWGHHISLSHRYIHFELTELLMHSRPPPLPHSITHTHVNTHILRLLKSEKYISIVDKHKIPVVLYFFQFNTD